MAYNALSKIGLEFEQVGKTLGINRIYIMKDVLIPAASYTILEMFSYLFVNSMVTISAVSFLSNTKNMTIALMINEFEGQLMFEAAAVVCMTILICNIIFKAIMYSIKNIYYRRNDNENN